MKNIKYILFITLIILGSACNEAYQEIEWDLNDQSPRLIVTGEVTSEYKYQTIYLRQSDSYFSNQALPRISGAAVSVSDGNNTYTFVEDSDFKGTYKSEVRFAGVVGRTYSLNIELESAINGETSYSASCKMNDGFYINNSVSYIYKNPLEEVAGGDSIVLLIYVFGDEPQEIGNYYSINLYRNSVLLNDTIDEQTVIYDDESGINGENSLTFFFMESFQESDTVTIELRSVDEDYYEFVDGVQKVAQGYDPFGFSGPPANPIGNIQGGEAFGYFLASYVSRHSSLPEYIDED